MTREPDNPRNMARQTVVVFTHSLLAPSMTFILSHAKALRRYEPVYAGARRVEGLDLPAGRVETANRGGPAGMVEEFLFRRFGIAGRLAGRLRRFGPRIVHAHFGLAGPAGLALADSLGVPLVVTYHGEDATITDYEANRSWRGREYLRGRRRVMDRAGMVIAVSDFIREKLVTKGYPRESIVTHRNGIDLEFFSPAGRPRENVVVFVGRFVEKKGCEFLLRALGSLREQGRPVRAVLVGEGPLRPQLERLATELGADVQFTGLLPLSEVRERLGHAMVVAVPSVTAASGDSEGLPTVILEAQAMGTPVIATRHAGNPEGVAEGNSAILVDERDVPGLANAIRYFLDNPQVVETFGRAGRAFVEANFRLETQVQGLERIYDRVRGVTVAAS